MLEPIVLCTYKMVYYELQHLSQRRTMILESFRPNSNWSFL